MVCEKLHQPLTHHSGGAKHSRAPFLSGGVFTCVFHLC
jgi:hypothetical protein